MINLENKMMEMIMNEYLNHIDDDLGATYKYDDYINESYRDTFEAVKFRKNGIMNYVRNVYTFDYNYTFEASCNKCYFSDLAVDELLEKIDMTRLAYKFENRINELVVNEIENEQEGIFKEFWNKFIGDIPTDSDDQIFKDRLNECINDYFEDENIEYEDELFNDTYGWYCHMYEKLIENN